MVWGCLFTGRPTAINRRKSPSIFEPVVARIGKRCAVNEEQSVHHRLMRFGMRRPKAAADSSTNSKTASLRETRTRPRHRPDYANGLVRLSWQG